MGGRTRVTDKGRSGRPSTSRNRKASSPREYRNQLNDITNALCCKGDCVEKWFVKLLTVTSVKAVKCILPLLFDSPSYHIASSCHLICPEGDCSGCHNLTPLVFVTDETRWRKLGVRLGNETRSTLVTYSSDCSSINLSCYWNTDSRHLQVCSVQESRGRKSQWESHYKWRSVFQECGSPCNVHRTDVTSHSAAGLLHSVPTYWGQAPVSGTSDDAGVLQLHIFYCVCNHVFL